MKVSRLPCSSARDRAAHSSSSSRVSGTASPVGFPRRCDRTGPHAATSSPMEAGRSNLAYQVYIPDVYTQLQRRGGDANPDLAVLQLLLGVQPRGAGQTAVVGDHRLFADAGGQLVGHPLHQPPGVDGKPA